MIKRILSYAAQSIVLVCIIFTQAMASGITPRSGDVFIDQDINAQIFPEVCSAGDGSFVVVWGGYGSTPVTYADVFGARFDIDGQQVGTAFQINTYTSGPQKYPTICCSNDGDFIVAWQGQYQDGSNWGVFAQRFSDDGSAAGSEFQVNESTERQQRSPRVGCESSGDFIVTWESQFPPPDSVFLRNVFARRYDAFGIAKGPEFVVDTSDDYAATDPDIAVADNGAFIVTWTDNGQDGSQSSILARAFATDATAEGAPFSVNTYTTSAQSRPRIARNPSGEFVVTWESNNYYTDDSQDGSRAGIFARRFVGPGVPNGDEFLVNAYTIDHQNRPAIAAVGTGFIVAWESQATIQGEVGQDGSEAGIFARTVSEATENTSPDAQLNDTSAGQQLVTALAALPAGGFVGAWMHNGSSSIDPRIVVRRFADSSFTCADADGNSAISASDALIALRASVGSLACDLCRCDVDNSGNTSATDALRILNAAVALPVALQCSTC